VEMESDAAGLDLIKFIRAELGNRMMRIILRAARPGEAPEETLIQQYDINDYKIKTDLSDDSLRNSLIIALRSFNDIVTIDENRRLLEWILFGSMELMQTHSTEQFLSGLLRQIQTMFNFRENAILCCRSGSTGVDSNPAAPRIIAGSGEYVSLIGSELSAESTIGSKEDILNAFSSGSSTFKTNNCCLYFNSADVIEIVIFLESLRLPTKLEQTMINIFWQTAAVSLSNINLVENLENKVNERTEALNKANLDLRIMATTDVLTNVNNRRNLLDQGEKVFQVSSRYKRPMAVIMLDVDHFKNVNDAYGHTVGDQVLQHVAKACQSLLRESDVFGRYGGEEFVAVCAETDKEGGMILADRLRVAVENMEVNEPQPLPRVTISVGVACLNPPDVDLAQIIDRADVGLYLAKGQGRNSVVFCAMDQAKKDLSSDTGTPTVGAAIEKPLWKNV